MTNKATSERKRRRIPLKKYDHYMDEKSFDEWHAELDERDAGATHLAAPCDWEEDYSDCDDAGSGSDD